MNNLLISEFKAREFIESYTHDRFVPSISFMYKHGSNYIGVDNSRQEFNTKKFVEEEDCLVWLENQYSSKLQESIETFPRLREWMTIQNLMDADAISQNTRYHAGIRKQLYGGENRLTKLIRTIYDASTDCMTFTFTTPATMKAHDPGYTADIVDPTNNFATVANPSHMYTMMIQVIDFLKWLKGTRPNGLGQITWREIKDVLDVAYVRVWCNCKSFHWFGKNYRAGIFDAALYPTNIPDNKTRSRFGDYDILCKHLGNLMKPQAIQFFLPQMASASQKQLKINGLL